MAYVAVILAMAFTLYFYRELVKARRYMGGAQ